MELFPYPLLYGMEEVAAVTFSFAAVKFSGVPHPRRYSPTFRSYLEEPVVLWVWLPAWVFAAKPPPWWSGLLGWWVAGFVGFHS